MKITETVTTFGDLAKIVDHARRAGAQDHDAVVAQTRFRGTRDGCYLKSVTVEVSEERGDAAIEELGRGLLRDPNGPTP